MAIYADLRPAQMCGVKSTLGSALGPLVVASRAQKVAFVLLCAFALVNPAVAQLGWYLWPVGIGGLSLMQWFQGMVFLLALVLLPRLYRPYCDISCLRRLLFLFAFGIFVFLSKTLLITNASLEVLREESILYFKIFFFVFIWLFIGLTIRTPGQARILLVCIVLGTSVDAIFKLYGYTTGSFIEATYSYAMLGASFGAEGISGKATIGFLISSLFLSSYLLKNKPWRAAILSCFFLAAIYVTFGRAEQVALCLSLLWYLFWSVFLVNSGSYRGIILRFMLCAAILGAIYFSVHGIEEVFARWTYELDKTGTVGSGRGVFYLTAWRWFRSANWLDFLIGLGYTKTKEMLDYASGAYVHTHSDFFDMMTFGGVLGLLLYISLFAAIGHIVRSIPRSSSEYGTSVAQVVGFTVMSLIAGQLGAPHSMITLCASLWCLRLLALSGSKET